MFVAFRLNDGVIIDRRKPAHQGDNLGSSYPYVARAFASQPLVVGSNIDGEEATHFLIVQSGSVRLELERAPDEAIQLGALQYASLLQGFTVIPEPGSMGLVISRLGARRALQVERAGPVERDGRLRYVDGCSDTLLLSPPKKGDPALNHLHVPTEIHQTPHFHPSDRIGVIAGGRGLCFEHPAATEAVLSNGDLLDVDLRDRREIELRPGMGWLIEQGTVHSFHTHELAPGEDPLDVIAFHPESNWGPDDESHPMLDYTLVGRGTAVRGHNSDGDYQVGGSSAEVAPAHAIPGKPGADM